MTCCNGETSEVETHDTRVALLTPPGRAAVATIAVFGNHAIEFVGAYFFPATDRPLKNRELGEICYGRWGDETVGEEIVLVCRTYAIVEIHCHGGDAAAAQILGDLEGCGCRRVGWAQWVEFQGGNHTTVAALETLGAARSERTAAILLDQLTGALAGEVNRCIQLLDNEQVDEVNASICELLERASLGLHLSEPWRVVIAGAPNVGKSSLLNRIVGYDRSIVVDLPGTTRDVVATSTVIDGWPVLLADTAGLRTSNDEIEIQGVRLAEQQLSNADLVVLVFDASQSWSDEDSRHAERLPEAIFVHNKADLLPADALPQTSGLMLSATTGDGVAQLIQNISHRLVPTPPRPGIAIPCEAAQVALLNQAKSAIAAGDLARARDLMVDMAR